MDPECQICFSNTTTITALPCKHDYCEACFLIIYSRFGGTCSFCKQGIFERVKCRDSLTNVQACAFYPRLCESTVDEEVDDKTVRMYLGHGKHAGVTVKNVSNGVYVMKINSEDEASKVLQCGDVILEINGLPAIDHKQVIDIIDYSTYNDRVVVCKLQNRSKLQWLKHVFACII